MDHILPTLIFVAIAFSAALTVLGVICGAYAIRTAEDDPGNSSDGEWLS